MSSHYKVLAHETFMEQFNDFLDKHTQSIQSLMAQIVGAAKDPLNFGKTMAGVQSSLLRGRIRRYHVSGRSGFRLICLIDTDHQVVMPVFLSSDVRAALKYDDIPWEDYAAQILDDLISERWEKFTVFTIPD